MVNDDGTTRPLAEGNAAGEAGRPGLGLKDFESIREDQENSYTITYHPDPSNHNEGFRKINIEIVPDVARNWESKA